LVNLDIGPRQTCDEGPKGQIHIIAKHVPEHSNLELDPFVTHQLDSDTRGFQSLGSLAQLSHFILGGTSGLNHSLFASGCANFWRDPGLLGCPELRELNGSPMILAISVPKNVD
jgi:hypothetical protein